MWIITIKRCRQCELRECFSLRFFFYMFPIQTTICSVRLFLRCQYEDRNLPAYLIVWVKESFGFLLSTLGLIRWNMFRYYLHHPYADERVRSSPSLILEVIYISFLSGKTVSRSPSTWRKSLQTSKYLAAVRNGIKIMVDNPSRWNIQLLYTNSPCPGAGDCYISGGCYFSIQWR